MYASSKGYATVRRQRMANPSTATTLAITARSPGDGRPVSSESTLPRPRQAPPDTAEDRLEHAGVVVCQLEVGISNQALEDPAVRSRQRAVVEVACGPDSCCGIRHGPDDGNAWSTTTHSMSGSGT